jgi:hypothetical protein
MKWVQRQGLWQTQWAFGKRSGPLANAVGLWQTQWAFGKRSGPLANAVGLWQRQGLVIDCRLYANKYTNRIYIFIL